MIPVTRPSWLSMTSSRRRVSSVSASGGAASEQLEVARHRVQRRPDLVRHLGHDASRHGQALGVAQPPPQLEELLVQPLHLLVALIRLGDGLRDPELELAAELVDAGHHLVEVPRHDPELVAGPHRHGRARLSRPDARDGLHEAPHGAIHHLADGEAHQERHHEHRGRREGEGPRAGAAGRLVGPLERETRGGGPGRHAGEGDRRHHFPVALLGASDQPRDHLPLLDAGDSARVNGSRRSAWLVATMRAPARRRRGCRAGPRCADAEDLLDLLVQERGALELPPIADGGRDLAGEGDGSLAQVLFDPAARQAERQRGEAERDDDEHGDAQEDELEPDTGAHRLRPLSRGGRSPGTAVRCAPRAGRTPGEPPPLALSSWHHLRAVQSRSAELIGGRRRGQPLPFVSLSRPARWRRIERGASRQAWTTTSPSP